MFDFSQMDDPKRQALLMLAAGLLSPVRSKGVSGFGEALSRGITGGLLGFNEATQSQRRNALTDIQKKMSDMQLADAQRKLDYNRALPSAMTQGVPASQTFAPDDQETPSQFSPAKPGVFDFTKLANIDARQAWQDKMAWDAAQQKQYHALPPDASLYTIGPDGKPAIALTNPKAQKPVDSWRALTPEEASARQIPKNGQGYQINQFGEIKAFGSMPPVTNVNVSADKGYASNIAEGLAKQDLEMINAARSAPERLASARRVKALLAQSPITGAGADWRLAFEQGLATSGFKNGDTAMTTESLASELAGQTLDAIRTSGLGAGQGFSNADREFLALAKGGKINLTSGTLMRLATLNERAAALHINRGNKIIERIRKSPGMKNISIDDIEMPVVLNFDAQGNQIP
jgi:hypothetical protein